MTLCWKYLTPIALFNLIMIAVWAYAFDGKSMFELFSAMGSGSAGGH
jgi:NADH-quinone oxidoreductase subunit H